MRVIQDKAIVAGTLPVVLWLATGFCQATPESAFTPEVTSAPQVVTSALITESSSVVELTTVANAVVAPSQSVAIQDPLTSQNMVVLPSSAKKPGRSSLANMAQGFEVEYALRSTWRGHQFSREGLRAPDMVFSTWRTSQGTTVSLTGDVEMARDTRQGRLLETSLFASRTWRRGNIRIEPGFYLYLRDRDFGSSTGEMTLSIGRRSGALRWFADGFVDVLKARGDYLMQAGLSHRFSPDEKSLVKTSLLIGRSSERVSGNLGFSNDTTSYATLSASWTRDVSSHLSIRPRLEATRFFSGDSRTFLKLSVALQWSS